MSRRQWQHDEMRQRSSPELPKDYRTFKTEEYEIPERIEALYAKYDATRMATFLQHPKAGKAGCPQADDLWLLIDVAGTCRPLFWEKNPKEYPDDKYTATCAVFFGAKSPHNFAKISPVKMTTNPVQRAQVEGVIQAMKYFNLPHVTLLKPSNVTKVIVMIDSVYVASAMTDNIRKWRTSNPPFSNYKGVLVTNHDLMKILDAEIEKVCARFNVQVEFWYKAMEGRPAEQYCLAEIETEKMQDFIAELES